MMLGNFQQIFDYIQFTKKQVNSSSSSPITTNLDKSKAIVSKVNGKKDQHQRIIQKNKRNDVVNVLGVVSTELNGEEKLTNSECVTGTLDVMIDNIEERTNALKDKSSAFHPVMNDIQTIFSKASQPDDANTDDSQGFVSTLMLNEKAHLLYLKELRKLKQRLNYINHSNTISLIHEEKLFAGVSSHPNTTDLFKSKSAMFPSPCYIFVDHSNITIGAEQFVAKILNNGFKHSKLEKQIRINYAVLIPLIRNSPVFEKLSVDGDSTSHLENTFSNRQIVKIFIAGSTEDQDIASSLTKGKKTSGSKSDTEYNPRVKSFLGKNNLNSLAGLQDYELEVLTLKRVWSNGCYKEQCVDELLHNRLLETLLDVDLVSKKSKATMILLTGDGNQGDFGRGFFSYVIKALDRGWYVELYSWSKALSNNYLILAKHPKFRFTPLEQYGLKIIKLNYI